MLTHLFVSNYALIDQLSLEFGKGLTIITGETGAGKSILLGALKLVLGERADLKSVKNPTEKCIVEAHFDLSKLNLTTFFLDNDIDYDDATILRREIHPSGKSRAFVNDIPVTLQVLNSLSLHLIDIHSQFETADLLKEEFQFRWIDAVANIQQQTENFAKEWSDLNLKKSLFKSLQLQKEEILKEFDYNSFLYEELSAIPLEDISIESLESEQFLLENAEDNAAHLASSVRILENDEFGILVQLNQIINQSKYFPEILKERIEALRIESRDILGELNFALEQSEINPERLSEIQGRLNQINLLLNKHQVQSISDLIAVREELNQKLEKSLNLDTALARLSKEINETDKQLSEKGRFLSGQRRAKIPQIEKEVILTMQKLGMPNSRLKFNISESDTFNAFGIDRLDLRFSANKGIEPKPLDKAVSGGERSRLMLAVKESVANHRELPTLILDEIDTGVSGKIAEAVGEIMAEAAANLQIFAITHLPQVAAFGNRHLKVVKTESGKLTTTIVVDLTEEDRILEIAQMLSGKNVSQAAIIQAKQLLNVR